MIYFIAAMETAYSTREIAESLPKSTKIYSHFSSANQSNL